MSYRLSQNARHTKDLLAELERDREVNVLREYLMRFALCPRQRDPVAAPIRFEELKDLAKHWNLHRQRHFWKINGTKEELVRTLYRHVTTKILSQDSRCDKDWGPATPFCADHGPDSVVCIPAPPLRRNSGPVIEERRTRATIRPTPPNRASRRDSVVNRHSGHVYRRGGTYEDSLIYLSRFRKPSWLLHTREIGALAPSNVHSDAPVRSAELQDESKREQGLSALTVDLTAGTSRDVQLKQECAFSIYHFSTIFGRETQMVAEGCMLALGKLALSDDLEVQRFCAASIVNLLCASHLGRQMADEGLLVAALELAKVPHEEVRRHTSMALCRFSHERTGQLRLVQEGCVSAIVSMLNVPDVDTREACVKTLINIAFSTSTTVTESVVHVLLTLAARPDVASVAFAAKAMADLSMLSEIRAKVVADGVLETVCQLAQQCSGFSVTEDEGGETTGRIRKHLATALSNFSGISSNLELLSHARILECLVELLKYNQPRQVRERCAVTIANISSYSPSLGKLARNKAVANLVAIAAHQSSGSVCKHTALCLSNMAASADSRAGLARIGAVPLLLRIVTEDGSRDISASAQQFAVLALCSLLAHSATYVELLPPNIVPAIAKLAHCTPHDRVRDLCANALFNASRDEMFHAALLQDETIRTVVWLCRGKGDIDDEGVSEVSLMLTPPAAGSGLPTVLVRYQECALACLFNLSFASDSRASMVRANVVATLGRVSTKLPEGANDLLRQCAAVLANLSFDADARLRMLADSGVQIIRHLIRAATAAAATSDVLVSASKVAIVHETLRCCATACCNLAADTLVNPLVLDMLLDLSALPHGPPTLTCAIAFAKLTANATNRALLTHCAELYPALTLMMRCGVEDVQIFSAAALCNLAVEQPTANPMGVRHVWKEGTVADFIVNALLRINSDSTKEICARALFNLLTHDELRAAHIKAGVLYALVKLARLESMETRTLCVTALYNLSCEPALAETLMEHKVTQVVAKLCEMKFSSQVNYRKLAASLTNLASESQPRSGNQPSDVSAIASRAVRLVECGALVALVVLCTHDDMPTRHACAAALCLLSAYEVNCNAMATLGLVDVLTSKLLSAAESADPFVELSQRQQNQYALNALCNISCYAHLHDCILVADAVPRILYLLAANSNQEDDAMVLVCVQTLANLSFHARHRRGLYTHDLMATLLCCAHTLRCSPRVGSVCAEIIAVLCEDPLHWYDLIKTGAVRVLCEISSDEAKASGASHAALRAVVYALSQLARCQKAGEIVLADGALDVVVYALGFAEDAASQSAIEARLEIAERCAVIIRALSTQGESICLMLMRNVRLVSLASAIVSLCCQRHCQLQASKHVILALYNLTSCRISMDDGNENVARTGETMRGLDTMVMSGVVPLLIRLSRNGGSDMAPACAVALAHVKHRIKERLAMSQAQESDQSTHHEFQAMDELMEAGVVTALLAMFELDSVGMQRVDRLAAAMPPTLPALRVATESDWGFHSSNTTVRFETSLPVCWDICNVAIDDARFVPIEPQSFLPLLSPVVPAAEATIQETPYGRFEILTVGPEKCRLRLEDSRFAKHATALIGPAESATSGTTDRPDAIATTIAVKRHDNGHQARAEETLNDNGNETRTPSFTQKMVTSRAGIARAAKNRGNAVLSISPSTAPSWHAVANRPGCTTNPSNGNNVALCTLSNRTSRHHHRLASTSTGVTLPNLI